MTSKRPPLRPISALCASLATVLLGACSLTALAPGAEPSPPLGVGHSAQATYDWAQIEQEIVAFQNQARQNPASLIPLLEARLAAMNDEGEIVNGCGRHCNIVTREGRAAVQEAIDFLRQQGAIRSLEASTLVAQAAHSHSQDQANGALGHTGSDGSTPGDRIARTGVLHTASGENIAYGSTTGQEVILDLIVDDGVPDRGHRLTLPGLKARGFSVRWVPIGIALTELLVRVPHGCKSSIPHDLSGGYISISGVATLRALMNSD